MHERKNIAELLITPPSLGPRLIDTIGYYSQHTREAYATFREFTSPLGQLEHCHFLDVLFEEYYLVPGLEATGAAHTLHEVSFNAGIFVKVMAPKLIITEQRIDFEKHSLYMRGIIDRAILRISTPYGEGEK